MASGRSAAPAWPGAASSAATRVAATSSAGRRARVRCAASSDCGGLGRAVPERLEELRPAVQALGLSQAPASPAYETSLGLHARRHEPGAPVGAIALERIFDVAVRLAEIALLLLEQRELEVWRGRPGLHRTCVVGSLDRAPRRRRERPQPGSPRGGSGPASAPPAQTIAASATPTPAVLSTRPRERTADGRLPTADCRLGRRRRSRAPPGSPAPPSATRPTMLSSHIQSMPAATTNAASTPAIAATSGRSDPGGPCGRSRPRSRCRSRSRAAASPTTPSSASVSSHSEWASRTNSGSEACSIHQDLVRAGAAAEHRLGLPLVDRRGPQLPPAAAGRADQVRAGEVALDQPHVGAGRLLEGLELVHRVVRGHPHREHRDRRRARSRPWPPGAASGGAPSRRTGTRPSTGPRRKGRAGPSDSAALSPSLDACAEPSGPFTSASRASMPLIASAAPTARDRGRDDRREPARGQRAEDDHAHGGRRRIRPARRSGRSRSPSRGPAPAQVPAARPAAVRRPPAAAAERRARPGSRGRSSS